MDSQLAYKFLITGGGGYIGFHIGLRLLQLRHEVILFDVNYPSKKWDPIIKNLVVKKTNGEISEEISCSHGTMEFVKGNKLRIIPCHKKMVRIIGVQLILLPHLY